MKKTTTLRKGAAALVLAVGVLAITGTGAGAATTPGVMAGFANAEALKVKLVVPALDDLKAALVAAGVPVAAIPATNVMGVSLEQKLSVNSANVRKGGSTIESTGFAAAGIGALMNRSAQSSCRTTACSEGESMSVLPRTALAAPLTPPATIGSIEVGAAESISRTGLDTTNHTGVVDLELDAAQLLGPDSPLAVVGGALTSLSNIVNTTVIPTVNPVIKTFLSTIEGVEATKAVRDELDRYASIGEIKPMKDPAITQLVSLKVLPSHADVVQHAPSTANGLRATASAGIADLDILGGWVSVGSAKLEALAYANGVEGSSESKSVANAKVIGATIGGLLGIDISEADLVRLADPETLKKTLRDTVPGLEAQVDDVAAAIDLLYNVAGVKIDYLEKRTPPATPRTAYAKAGTLRITVAPKIPILANGVTPAGSVVPRLAADDYVSTGLSLVIDLPSVEVQSTSGGVACVGRCATRTGVGTAWGAIFLLFGAAFTVKRFGLSF